MKLQQPLSRGGADRAVGHEPGGDLVEFGRRKTHQYGCISMLRYWSPPVFLHVIRHHIAHPVGGKTGRVPNILLRAAEEIKWRGGPINTDRGEIENETSGLRG